MENHGTVVVVAALALVTAVYVALESLWFHVRVCEAMTMYKVGGLTKAFEGISTTYTVTTTKTASDGSSELTSNDDFSTKEAAEKAAMTGSADPRTTKQLFIMDKSIILTKFRNILFDDGGEAWGVDELVPGAKLKRGGRFNKWNIAFDAHKDEFDDNFNKNNTTKNDVFVGKTYVNIISDPTVDMPSLAWHRSDDGHVVLKKTMAVQKVDKDESRARLRLMHGSSSNAKKGSETEADEQLYRLSEVNYVKVRFWDADKNAEPIARRCQEGYIKLNASKVDKQCVQEPAITLKRSPNRDDWFF